MRRGVSINRWARRRSSSRSIFLRAKAAATEIAARADNCATKAFVEATPISGPAKVGSTASASRAIELSGTLTTAIVFQPLRLHRRKASNVSAVSPDWEINKAAARPAATGSR